MSKNIDKEKIYQAVLKKIKPSSKEEEKIRKFLSDLERVAKTVSGCDVAFVGSIGKQTWISGDHDIDLFIMMPPSTPREDLEKKGLEFGQKIAKEMRGKWKIKYAEHPYTQALIKGFEVDIVPCYKIFKGDRIISAVDRSPLHLEFVIENISPAMQDQIRLLKQFCKGIGVYGSDAKNLGFSGYICELLIIRFGSFEAALKEAAGWEIPITVDVEVQREGQHHFQDQPLVVVDPTDPQRNAAAILSADHLLKFMNASQTFLEKPGQDYFFPKSKPPLSAKEISHLQQRSSRFFCIMFPRPDVIDDVLYPQIRKTLYRIESHLKYNEFLSLRSIEHVGKSCFLIFELENWSLPNIKKMVGPPIFSHRHSREFLDKYGSLAAPKGFGPYVEENRWIADKTREFTDAEDLLHSVLKMNSNDMQNFGIPKYIADSMKKARLLDTKLFFFLLKKDKELSARVRETYFEKLIV